jgi:hypothetical protein
MFFMAREKELVSLGRERRALTRKGEREKRKRRKGEKTSARSGAAREREREREANQTFNKKNKVVASTRGAQQREARSFSLP